MDRRQLVARYLHAPSYSVLPPGRNLVGNISLLPMLVLIFNVLLCLTLAVVYFRNGSDDRLSDVASSKLFMLLGGFVFSSKSRIIECGKRS